MPSFNISIQLGSYHVTCAFLSTGWHRNTPELR